MDKDMAPFENKMSNFRMNITCYLCSEVAVYYERR